VERLRFTRTLVGDVYALVLVRRPGAETPTIEASFEAAPF
jgi:hypothetical protein